MKAETVERIVSNLLDLAERATEGLDDMALGLTSRAEVRKAYEEIQSGPPEGRYAQVQALVQAHGLDEVTKFLDEERQLYIRRELRKRSKNGQLSI